MKVWNKVQLIVILTLLGVGTLVFLSPYIIKKLGVVVVSIPNKDCQNIHVGDVITEAGGNQIKGNEDFSSLRFQANQFISLVVNSGPGGCVTQPDGSLGVETQNVGTNAVILGVDLIGGNRYIVDTTGIQQNSLQNISNTVRTRVAYLGLGDVKIQNVGNKLEITTNKNTNINQLLFRGFFEGDIQQGFVLKNNEASFMIGNDNYTIRKVGNDYLIGNSTHPMNNSFYLKNVKAKIANETNTSVILSFTAFNNSDILGEVPGYTQVTFDGTNGIYTFNTLASLSPNAGIRFNEITQNIKTIVIGSQINLDAALVFELDGNELSRLGLPANLKGRQINTIYIVISDPSQPSLLTKRAMVEAAINGGSLPRQLSIAQTENIEASQKNNVLPLVGIILAALFVSPLILGGKFKKIKHNVFSVLIGGAELVSVISLFVGLQTVYKLNSSFDFYSLIGIAVLSVNWMINVISLNLSTHAQRELTLRVKYKKIISLNGVAKLFLVVVVLVFAALGHGAASMIVFFGILLDLLLFRPFYKSFVS